MAHGKAHLRFRIECQADAVQRAVIVGAGVFGGWVADALHQRGWKVTVLDQHGPANGRASSGGETRIIRAGYGSLAIYTRWARESLPAWLALEDRAAQRLFVKTGALFLARDRTWLADTAATLQGEGVRSEWIQAESVRRRFPQLNFAATGDALFEPDAGALFARRAVQTLARTLREDGVRIMTRRVDADALIREAEGDTVIFAAGAWLPSLFPALLGEVIVPTRQEVFFFGAPPGDARFDASHLPAWVAFDEGIYGLPDLEHRGVKVAFDAHGPRADPE